MMTDKLEDIHESLVNRQRQQMVNQINEYWGSDFWFDYKNYLDNMFCNLSIDAAYTYFTDAVISYYRITNR